MHRGHIALAGLQGCDLAAMPGHVSECLCSSFSDGQSLHAKVVKQDVSWQDVLRNCFLPSNCFVAQLSTFKFPLKKERGEVSLLSTEGAAGYREPGGQWLSSPCPPPGWHFSHRSKGWLCSLKHCTLCPGFRHRAHPVSPPPATVWLWDAPLPGPGLHRASKRGSAVALAPPGPPGPCTRWWAE